MVLFSDSYCPSTECRSIGDILVKCYDVRTGNSLTTFLPAVEQSQQPAINPSVTELIETSLLAIWHLGQDAGWHSTTLAYEWCQACVEQSALLDMCNQNKPVQNLPYLPGTHFSPAVKKAHEERAQRYKDTAILGQWVSCTRVPSTRDQSIWNTSTLLADITELSLTMNVELS